MPAEIVAKRVYDEVGEEDGCRVLVDRLWPRGVSKEAARIDLWPLAFTPSDELRKWYHAASGRSDDFAARYTAELVGRRLEIEQTLRSLTHRRVTLVTATKDLERGHVGVLMRFLQAVAT
ncbi:MAG: DUF488 family protein [Gemmataceae bacterium]|nr:DUF488 family protein [Gemmataceae bacterium]